MSDPQVDRLNVLRHWLEADELPRCQHCPALADERSFMCEDHAGEADEEVETLRDQLAGAVARIAELEAETDFLAQSRDHWRELAERFAPDESATTRGQ